MDWKTIETAPDEDEITGFALFFVPPGNYVFATPKDIEEIKKEFPLATHYKVITKAPLAE